MHTLAKTDPETYSMDNLARDRRTVCGGVRNRKALRDIREIRPGDRVFMWPPRPGRIPRTSD